MGQQVKDFLARFETIPDLLELDHLTVSGDVTFGKGVSLKVSSFLVLVGHNGRRRGVRSSLFQASDCGGCAKRCEQEKPKRLGRAMPSLK